MDENKRSASVRMSDHLHENTHMVYSTEQINEVWISTHKTARAASNWLTLLVNGIIQNRPIPEVLAECVEIIAKLCKRACPKRDLNHGLYQFGVLPLVDIQTID
jgi:hypothetical protein